MSTGWASSVSSNTALCEAGVAFLLRVCVAALLDLTELAELVQTPRLRYNLNRALFNTLSELLAKLQ